MNSEQAELELLRDQAPTAFEEAVRQLWPSVVKAKTNLTGMIEELVVAGETLASFVTVPGDTVAGVTAEG